MPLRNHFASIELAPPDPIFGLRQKFLEDGRTDKIDLCVGVYLDDSGTCRKLPSIVAAEQYLRSRKDSGLISETADYLPIAGLAGYLTSARALLFGDAPSSADGRTVSVQSIGGTSALRYAAELLRAPNSSGTVYISDPSWPVHHSIFERVGYRVVSYPYYDRTTGSLAIGPMLTALRQAPKDSVVLLHACCHNPTGIDLTEAQWRETIAVIEERELFPLIDIAYQGFAENLDADAWIIRELDRLDIPFAAAQSFSKNFSLYNRRTGALHLRCSTREEGERVLSQLKGIVRLTNSNPPIDGAEIVTTILHTPEMRTQWTHDLSEMRLRMRKMRNEFLDALRAEGLGSRFESLATQRGMFSYTGLTKEQAIRLRSEHGVYILDSGRICVAALNSQNLRRSAKSIATVCR